MKIFRIGRLFYYPDLVKQLKMGLKYDINVTIMLAVVLIFTEGIFHEFVVCNYRLLLSLF